jgi:hypothetical protein
VPSAATAQPTAAVTAVELAPGGPPFEAYLLLPEPSPGSFRTEPAFTVSGRGRVVECARVGFDADAPRRSLTPILTVLVAGDRGEADAKTWPHSWAAGGRHEYL